MRSAIQEFELELKRRTQRGLGEMGGDPLCRRITIANSRRQVPVRVAGTTIIDQPKRRQRVARIRRPTRPCEEDDPRSEDPEGLHRLFHSEEKTATPALFSPVAFR